MKIVIEIPEELKNKIDNANEDNYRTYIWWFETTLYCAIKNGIPLPKGHGDLIDKGKFKKWIETQDGDKLMTEYYLDALDMQETIVRGLHDGDID